MTALDQIAPYPKRKEEADAETMARYFTAHAQVHLRIALDHPDPKAARESFRAVSLYYALAYMLREQMPSLGDSLARTIWVEWDDGTAMASDLWNWLREYEIDTAAVNKVAGQVIAESAVQSHPDGGA